MRLAFELMLATLKFQEHSPRHLNGLLLLLHVSVRIHSLPSRNSNENIQININNNFKIT